MIASIKDNDIEHAATIADIDEALSYLQRIAGITDGGVADLVFSDLPDWESLSIDQRVRGIHQWMKAERAYETDAKD